jgi:hypothetical protein
MSALTLLRYRLGFALRETGQAMERLGATLQGINSFQEQSEAAGGPRGAGIRGAGPRRSVAWRAPGARSGAARARAALHCTALHCTALRRRRPRAAGAASGGPAPPNPRPWCTPHCRRRLSTPRARPPAARTVDPLTPPPSLTPSPRAPPRARAVPQLKPVLNAGLKLPQVGRTSWIAPSAQVVGDVTVGDNCSIWYNCTVRGERRVVCVCWGGPTR